VTTCVSTSFEITGGAADVVGVTAGDVGLTVGVELGGEAGAGIDADGRTAGFRCHRSAVWCGRLGLATTTPAAVD
jgi:hypothetical protein